MPFPPALPVLLNADLSLSAALAAATAEAHFRFPSLSIPLRPAVSLVAIDDSRTPPGFAHAGWKDRETDYSASLLKVAAMYAAFQLRESMNSFASSVADATSAALFAHMSASFDPLIDPAVPLISGAPGVAPSMRVPKYPSIFAAVPLATGGFSIVFNGAFLTAMRAMIIVSDNNAAATCIKALGYSWINGTLASAGFFNSATSQGIWLAGTFNGTWPYIRVPSVNDGLAAQALTCFDLASLYAHLVARTLVGGNPTASDEMLGLLAETAAPTAEPSWLTRTGIAPSDIQFTGTHTKIGVGPLKPENGGFSVSSEGSVLVHVGTGRRFIAAWQNSLSDTASLAGLAFIVDRAIRRFLGVP